MGTFLTNWLRPLIGAACCYSMSAIAADNSTVLQQYHAQTEVSLAQCRSTVATALYRIGQGDSAKDALDNGNGSDGDGNWPKCVAAERSRTLQLFQAGFKATRKPPAREALKAYHAAFAAALEGIMPADGELQIDFRRRQSQTDARLKELWARFELELL